MSFAGRLLILKNLRRQALWENALDKVEPQKDSRGICGRVLVHSLVRVGGTPSIPGAWNCKLTCS